jgi:LPXTG-motif cell wall-anchored protein
MNDVIGRRKSMNIRIRLFTVIISVGLVASAVVGPTIAFAFGGGDGLSEGTAYQIEDCQDLQDMANDLDAYYILVDDIDCSDTVNWNAGAGFIPVGTNGSRFVGQLDGDDYTVSGLFINTPSTDDKGIIGVLGAAGVVKDIVMTNVDITARYNIGTIAGVNYGLITGVSTSGTIAGLGSLGGITSGAYVNGSVTNSDSSVDVTATSDRAGGIVGWCEPCTLTNVSATGDVSGSAYVGGVVGQVASTSTVSGVSGHGTINGSSQYVGGAVGYAGGALSITLSYATGDVINTEDFGYSATGGFIGALYTNASVTKSFATGDVTNVTAGNGAVGGFAGLIASGASVSDIFARGNATGVTKVGGLVGTSEGFSGSNTITNGYSTGTAIGSSSSGGLQGFSSNSLTANSYWDAESSGILTSPAGGLPLSTANAKLEVSYESWDFDNDWFIDADTNNGYPCLQGLGGICSPGSTAPPTTTTTTTTTAPISSADEDTDGVADSVENAGPNNGDGNGDGTPDSEQSNVASLPSESGAGYVTVVSPDGTTIVATSSAAESASGVDSEYDYTFGLVSFTVTGVTPGATIEMNVYFATDQAADGFVGRKFTNGEYSTLDGSSLQSVLVGTTRALLLTYGLQDGGALDEDGLANGTIIDPVGLGSAAGSLPATGTNMFTNMFFGLMLMMAGAGVIFSTRRRIFGV